MERLVSVITVNYNGIKFLEACLSSLFKVDKNGFSLEIIVVDNLSRDGSIDFVKRRFPEIRIIENDINKGITISCYQVLKEEDADICIKFDNDIEILTDFWLKSMVEIYRMVKNKYRYFILGTNIPHFICQTF